MYYGECLKIRSGVPQGYILGHLIFCLFINYICNVNLHSNSKMSLYADDTAIIDYGKTVKEVQKNLQDNFDTICKWLDINNMRIHPQKTKIVAFGHRKILGNYVLSITFWNTWVLYLTPVWLGDNMYLKLLIKSPRR